MFWDENYKFIKRIINFITSTIVIISTFVGFILTYNAYEKVNENQNQIHFLFGNWQQNYITDIITIKNTDSWPDGFEPMLKAQWSGTIDGCLYIVRVCIIEVYY